MIFRLAILTAIALATLPACNDDPGSSGTADPDPEPTMSPEPDAPERGCDEMIQALCEDACACRQVDDDRCAIAVVFMGTPVTTFYDGTQDCVDRHINLQCDNVADLAACDADLRQAECTNTLDDPDGSTLMPASCLPDR